MNNRTMAFMAGLPWLLVVALGWLVSPAHAAVIGGSSSSHMVGEGSTFNLGKVQKAFDTSDPRGNVQFLRYDPSMSYKLRVREFMTTTIVLPTAEQISGFVIGDQKNFEFTPLQKQGLPNIATLHPVYPGADTNLTIIGVSGNLYNFYVRADSTDSRELPAFTVYIEDGLIDKKLRQQGIATTSVEHTAPDASPVGRLPGEYLKSLALVEPDKLNFAYEYVKTRQNQRIKPLSVFDDGHWTYFRFSDSGNLDSVASLPAVYAVIDGYDTPVNTRVVNGTLIAETVGTGWTLRAGETYLCLRKAKSKK